MSIAVVNSLNDPETVERNTDGQKRVFDEKPVSLTPEAENYLGSPGA